MPAHRISSVALLALLCTACRAGVRPVPRPLALPTSVADTVVSSVVAPGARLHRLVNLSAPWRAFVLEVDLSCSTLRALKGSSSAVGRTTTSALLDALPATEGAIAAVNADFFLFAPPGVPTNLHVERGVLLSGPGPKPVVTAHGHRVQIDSVYVQGHLRRGGSGVRHRAGNSAGNGADDSAASSVHIDAWNRPTPARVGIVDARWGVPLDSVVRQGSWRLEPIADHATRREGTAAALEGTYVVRRARAGDTLVYGDTLLLHQPQAVSASSRTLDLRAGDTVRVQLGLASRGTGIDVADAVGGRPIVLADSVVTRDVDTEGNEGFRHLNPRSAIGVNRAGTRAFIAVIDGRRPGYSMGMTLRQVGELMQSLGATRALNLDGGGSSALAVREMGATKAAVVNRPSDGSERPVGNALAITSRCGKVRGTTEVGSLKTEF